MKKKIKTKEEEEEVETIHLMYTSKGEKCTKENKKMSNINVFTAAKSVAVCIVDRANELICVRLLFDALLLFLFCFFLHFPPFLLFLTFKPD